MHKTQLPELEKKIEALIGECEVERTKDGQYIVLYMNLVSSPPPKGKTPEEAMEKFIEWFGESSFILRPDLPGLDDFTPEAELDNADNNK